MALVTDVLQTFGLIAAPPVVSDPSARLCLVCPDGAGVAEGTLTTTDGGLDRSTSPQPRVVAFVSAETTVRGLADRVLTLLATIVAPSAPLPDTRTVARAILAYHRADLGLPQAFAVGVPNRLPGLSAWQVGRGVRLPIELTTAGLVTDLARWTSLAASADPSWDVLFDLPPQPLALPDADADATYAAGVVAAHPTRLADAAGDVRAELLLNPSKAVFRLLALLTAADETPTAQPAGLWTELMTVCSPDELTLLAATLPGAAVLRACYRRLAAASADPAHDPAIDTAVVRLDTALGLAGTTPADLTAITPSVLPAELPTSTGWQGRAVQQHRVLDDLGEPVAGRHQLVLGRAYFVGDFGTEGHYTGPAYVGNAPYRAPTYAAAHHDEVYGSADATLTARLDVMLPISTREAFLDGIRFRDRAIVSFGIQQWSAHVDDELAVLLWNLRVEHPDDWDVHFGIHGLGLQLTSTWPAGTPGITAGTAKTVTLSRAVPGGANVPMPAAPSQPDQPADRLTFFGGAGVPSHPHHFRYDPPTAWAGWLRAAARCSRPLRDRELVTAANRFGRIRATVGPWPAPGDAPGSTVTVDQLFTSVQGAALLLDHHINAPGYVFKDVGMAIAQVQVTPASDANGLTAAWRTAFETRYAAAARYGPGIAKLDATIEGKLVPGRQSAVLKLPLSPVPGTFGGW